MANFFAWVQKDCILKTVPTFVRGHTFRASRKHYTLAKWTGKKSQVDALVELA